jgi:mannose/fructose-specific phosphotransferase system component IIA
MTPLLILTHGEFGPVLLKSAEAMYGPQREAAALALAPDETREAFAARVAEAVAALSSCPLVLVDLACGTPWNVALLEGCADKGEVLAGLSLPLLLETLGLRETMSPRDLAKEVARMAPQTFVRASEMLSRDPPGGCA